MADNFSQALATTTGRSLHRQQFLAALFLLLLVAYLPLRGVQENDFVNYDDYRYVLNTNRVRDGITVGGTLWAFSNLEAGFWHPLTWLSHMLDVELYGMNPAGHHLTSLLLHLANALLLFLFLERTTKALWRSAIVAGLFAVHPLHVESVAWVSQRKDLLSTLFWGLALLAYAGYAKAPVKRTYFVTLLLFCLGLMSKSMVVTFPLILLVLDYWPLQRLQGENLKSLSSWKPLILEKMPLLALSLGFTWITYFAENSLGALPSVESYPLHTRLANAVVSYATYAMKMVFPSNLSPIYLHPGFFPIWKVASALAFILCVSYLVVHQRRRRPYLLAGWLWYLITLLPVIGLIQIGSHAYADRYTYLPLTGLFLMVVWGVPSKSAFSGKGLLSLGLLISVILCCLGWMTSKQVRCWKDSVALFQKAVEADPDNYLAHNNLGFTLALRGRLDEAEDHYQAAIRLNPGYIDPLFNLANVLEVMGKRDEAICYYRKVIDLNPSLPNPHRRLGRLLLQEGQSGRALVHLTEVVRLDPSDAECRQLVKTLREQTKQE